VGRRDNVVVVITVIIVLTVAFLSVYMYSDPDPVPENTFIVETIGNPDSMDPHTNYESRGWRNGDLCFGSNLHYNIYETLYTYPWGSNNTEPSVPLLASAAPVISADGMQYNITLRENVIFHDGTPFNASCVKWNFERAIKQFDTHGPVWMIAEPLKGGEDVEAAAYSNGTRSAEFIAAFDHWQANSSAIVILDTYTVQFNLEHPFTPFIAAITYPVGSLMSPSYVLSNPNNDTGPMDSHWGVLHGESHTWMETHTCGTGPYLLDDWRPNEFVKMVIFEDYWRADVTEAAIRPPAYAGTLTEIYYKTNEDTTGRLQNLRTGLADSVYWPTTNADVIWNNVTLGSRDPNIDVITGGFSYTLMAFTFNLNPVNITRGAVMKEVQSPFIYRELRKCFAYAFDYQAAINVIVRGWGFQAKGFIPQGMFGHDSSYWLERYDIGEAVAWWNSAMNVPGFVEAINAMEGYIDLFYSSGNTIRKEGYRLMKEGFSRVMTHQDVNLTGISPTPEVRVNELGFDGIFEKRENNELPIWLIGWAPDYADPHDYAWRFVHSNGTFMIATSYGNDTVDEWIVNASKSNDPAKRLDLYAKIQAQVTYDQPSIYMYQPREFEVRRAWLEGSGLEYSPVHGYYWYHIYKNYET
jgi:peptide/nickel transport system substrate-binding protein